MASSPLSHGLDGAAARERVDPGGRIVQDLGEHGGFADRVRQSGDLVERPGLVSAVLATVDEVFQGAAWEVRLRRQAPPAARPAPAARESLSWT